MDQATVAAAEAQKKASEGYKAASSGIDNMMNSLIDKAALVTKHWKLQGDDNVFFLTVRHYAMTKMYILSISGLLVLVNSKVVYRHTDPIEDRLEVPFTLSGRTGKLLIEVTPDTKDKKQKVYTYTLFYHSEDRRADFLTDSSPDDWPGISDSVTVEDGGESKVDGSNVQYYNVVTTTNGQRITARKRFKEFDTLARLLRSAYADAPELLARFPKLPAKTYLKANSGAAFVEERRAQLQTYMQSCLALDRMTYNPDALHFLGVLRDNPAGSGGGAPANTPAPAPAPAPAPVPSEPDPFGEDDDDDAL